MIEGTKPLQTDNSSFLLAVSGVIGTGYFCSERFPDEVCSTVSQLVTCTRVLWQKTKVLQNVLILIS